MFHGQASPNLTFLLKSWTPCPPGQRGGRPACYQHSVQKSASLMVWGCISAYGMNSLHDLEGTMNAERYIKFLEQHMFPPDDVYFSRTMRNHILQLLQQHGFVVEESGY